MRCIRRLEELLRQMSCAAKAIGNHELEAKFLEGKSDRQTCHLLERRVSFRHAEDQA